ncbi:hypothetical protein FHS19_006309 [Paenibacillus rhizosphaerae]|uniref:Uncharacterized protein n=1 Tax=Paenibacillus rhizosphaerae TaxID=297318 RepID=A0A839TXG6_9BACL|nr:hypothetical protein [Paenibacillus rhizosphaerae]
MYECYFKMNSAEKRQIDLRFAECREAADWFKIWRMS